MENPKEGIKTSEFWITLIPAVSGVFETMKGDQETGRLLMICATILAGMYIISRTFIKR